MSECGDHENITCHGNLNAQIFSKRHQKLTLLTYQIYTKPEPSSVMLVFIFQLFVSFCIGKISIQQHIKGQGEVGSAPYSTSKHPHV